MNNFLLANTFNCVILLTVVLGLALRWAEFPSDGRFCKDVCLGLAGRHATDTHEPRQVRKEAAISDGVCVVDRSRFCL